MTVNLTNMLSTIALIGLLAVPTVGVADGSDAYQACQDMKWKAGKQAKKNCFRDLALSYEVVMANGSTDTDTSELEDEIAELEAKLEESEEGIAELEGKLEESEAEIDELEGKLEDEAEAIQYYFDANEALGAQILARDAWLNEFSYRFMPLLDWPTRRGLCDLWFFSSTHNRHGQDAWSVDGVDAWNSLCQDM